MCGDGGKSPGKCSVGAGSLGVLTEWGNGERVSGSPVTSIE